MCAIHAAIPLLQCQRYGKKNLVHNTSIVLPSVNNTESHLLYLLGQSLSCFGSRGPEVRAQWQNRQASICAGMHASTYTHIRPFRKAPTLSGSPVSLLDSSNCFCKPYAVYTRWHSENKSWAVKS